MAYLMDDDLDELFYEDSDPDAVFGFTPDLDDIFDRSLEEMTVTPMECRECNRQFLVGSAYDHTAENADMCPRCRKSWQDFVTRLEGKVIEFPTLKPKAA